MLGEVDHLSRGFYADFFAGLTLLVVDLFLRLFVQRPIQFECHCLGHEHAQIWMRAHIHRMATGTLVAGTGRGGVFAQPSAGEF